MALYFDALAGIDIDALLSGSETATETAQEAAESKAKPSQTRNNSPPESESYSIANTRELTWKEQLDRYFGKSVHKLKSSDSLYLGTSDDSVKSIRKAPLYIPTSVINKAMREGRGSRSGHGMSESDIYKLEDNMKKATVIIDNPSRNALVYISENPENSSENIVATFDMNNDLFGENAHKATSIHPRESVEGLLKKLDNDATVYVKNRKKFNNLLSGMGIQSSELLASVEFVDTNVAQSEPDVNSYSAEDGEYLTLAADPEGNRAELQAMVDEAARRAGYTRPLFHGTPNGTFTVFRDWQYFTEDRSYADRYQNQGASENYKKTANNPRTYAVYAKFDNPFDTRNRAEKKIFDNEFYRKWGNGAPLSERGLPDWTDGDDLIEFFEENGYEYDAILLDEGGTGGYGDEVIDRGISYAIHKSAQIKSADPVTYDDNGNIIPLSQRFNSENEDIRYSIEDDLKENLTAVYNNEFDSSRDEVHIGSSSNFITDVIGAEAFENYMPANKAYRAMATEEKAIFDGKPTGEKYHYHGIGIDGLYDILVASEEPIAAYADTPSKDNKRENRIVLVTDKEIDGGLGVVVEELDTKALQNAHRVDAHKTITVYTKDNIQNAVADAIAEGRILHIDKKRSQTLRSGVKGANYPTAISGADFANNIRRFWENVKWKKSGNTEMSFESDIEAEPEWKKVLGQYDSFSAEEEVNAKEEAERRKQFRSTVNKESLTNLRERLSRLDGRIEGYERYSGLNFERGLASAAMRSSELSTWV